jgi:hypothetical protein
LYRLNPHAKVFFAQNDLATGFGIAFVVHVVRRVCENQIRRVPSHEPFHIGAHRGITAEDPLVAGNCSRRLGKVRDLVFIRQTLGSILLFEQPLKLDVIEPN